MSETITLHGHPVSKGVAEGEALVCDKPLSFIAVGISNEEGIVRIDKHPLNGQSIAGKVADLRHRHLFDRRCPQHLHQEDDLQHGARRRDLAQSP